MRVPPKETFFLALDVGLRNTGLAYQTRSAAEPKVGLVSIPKSVWNDKIPSLKEFEEYVLNTAIVQDMIWELKDAQVMHPEVEAYCFIEMPPLVNVQAELRKERQRKQQAYCQAWHQRYWQKFMIRQCEELQVTLRINDVLQASQWRYTLGLNRTKEDALRYVKNVYDIQGVTDHEADAVCILEAYMMRFEKHRMKYHGRGRSFAKIATP